MEQTVQSLQRSYTQLLSSAASVLEAKEAEDQEGAGERENGRGRGRGRATTAARTDAALESFLQNWQLFHVACDEAQEFVESVRQRIGLECLVDEATGSISGSISHSAPSSGATTTTTSKAGSDGNSVRKPGLPPLSAVRLEQMSKAVRWLVLELQQSSSNNNNTINNASGLISTSAPPPPPPQGPPSAFGSLSAMASTMASAASSSSVGTTTTTTESRPLSATPSSASEDGGAQ